MAGTLDEKYEGDLNRLHFFAADEKDLETKLRALGKGIGPVTVRTFLREMRGLWEKAGETPLSQAALFASRSLGLTKATDTATALAELRTIWEGSREADVAFSDIEVALEKLGKNYCRRQKCLTCPLRPHCQNANRREER